MVSTPPFFYSSAILKAKPSTLTFSLLLSQPHPQYYFCFAIICNSTNRLNNNHMMFKSAEYAKSKFCAIKCHSLPFSPIIFHYLTARTLHWPLIQAEGAEYETLKSLISESAWNSHESIILLTKLNFPPTTIQASNMPFSILLWLFRFVFASVRFGFL